MSPQLRSLFLLPLVLVLGRPAAAVPLANPGFEEWPEGTPMRMSSFACAGRGSCSSTISRSSRRAKPALRWRRTGRACGSDRPA